MKMPVLQSFWFLLAAGALLCEGARPLPRAAMAATLAGITGVALLVHIMTQSRLRPLARVAAALAPVRLRTGLRIGVTDDAGTQWVLHFLPLFGSDLRIGDPAFAEGHRNRRGEFRAMTVTNIRTGGRHISRWALSTITMATCAVVMALVLLTTTG
ncbi:hypothetical protein [Nocardia huaxiensis]|uniref:Uncharacterized protein n=1 Tax=Nocardia huaxiensis TaxID=2755382 RepID=A0A7D6ZCR0_9NOCA|nr:hypothetical protein [Nocardia huaxiensis]QLY30558.1 hypothetical protein H0264_36530 [Nocardia huaxiensis]UFS95840.1 hypothetical protein LPY97_35145 [Nocardia huaxiensis]